MSGEYIGIREKQRIEMCGEYIGIREKQAGPLTILYIKNANEESFIGFKVNSCDVLSTF